MSSPERPLVSVVTPSLNQAQFLDTTMRSVLQQTYPRIEYMVMDGGSSDGSAELIKLRADQLAYWVSAPDGGQAEAVNAGWRRASGDVLAYINADDWYCPGAVRRAVDFFQLHPEADILYSALQIVDVHGRPAGAPVEPPEMSAEWLLRYPLPQPTMFVRRRLIERIGLFDESLHYVFDWDFCLRAMLSGARLVRLPGPPLAAFRAWEGQKTHANFDRHVQEQLRMRDKLMALPGLSAKMVGRIGLSKGWVFLWPAYQWYLRGEMAASRDFLHQAVGMDRLIWLDSAFVGLYARTLLGRGLSRSLRRLKGRQAGMIS